MYRRCCHVIALVISFTLAIPLDQPFGPCIHSLDRYHKDTCHFIFHIKLLFPGQYVSSVYPVVLIDPTALTASAWRKSDLAGSPAAINMMAAAALNSTGYPVQPVLAVASLGDVSWTTMTWAPDPTFFMCSAATVRYVVRAPDATIGRKWMAVLNAQEFCLLATETIPASWGWCELATWASLQMDGRTTCPSRHLNSDISCPLEPSVKRVAAYTCRAIKEDRQLPWTFAATSLRQSGNRDHGQRQELSDNSEDQVDVLQTVKHGGSLFIIAAHGQGRALVLMRDEMHETLAGGFRKRYASPTGLLSSARADVANTETADLSNTLLGELIMPSSIPLSGSRGRLAGRLLEVWYFFAGIVQIIGAGSSSLGQIGVLAHVLCSDTSWTFRLRLLGGVGAHILAFVQGNVSASQYHCAVLYLLLAIDFSMACRLGDVGFSTTLSTVILTLTVCNRRLQHVACWRQHELATIWLCALVLDTLWIQWAVCFPIFVVSVTHLAPGFVHAWYVGMLVIGVWCTLLPLNYRHVKF